MDKMQLLASLISSNAFAAWAIPVAIVVICAFAGWIVEQIVIRWAQRLAKSLHHPSVSTVGRAVRGHVTFWGFLLGAGIASSALVITSTTKVYGILLGTWIQDGLLALFLLSLTFMIANLVTALIAASAATTSRPVVSLVSNVIRFAVLAIGFLLVLPVIGVNITPWLTTLGIAGLAVSLALQATLTDLVSGILLLATRQVTVGDYVKLSTGEEGYVKDITWRTTTIRQLSNNIVIVPNSKITSSSLTNFHTTSQTTSVTVDLGVSYSSDLDLVERVTSEVAQDVMQTVQGGMPEFQPFIRYNALGDYSVRLSVIMQAHEVTDQYLIKHEFIKRLRARYREEGITIPYPIQTVQLRETQAIAATSATDGPDAAANGSGQTVQANANSNDASSR